MTLDNNSTKQEAAATWRYFASWREKLFGGFLAVLAALGISFFRTPLPIWRSLVCLTAVVVSLVFWLIDFRTSQLLNASQAAAAKLGTTTDVFAVLEAERFEKSNRWLTYGFAVDILVGAVVAASSAGAYVYWNRVPDGTVGSVASAILVLVLVAFLFGTQRIRSVRFDIAKKASSKAKV